MIEGPDDVEVRGPATAEEVAAIVAALSARERATGAGRAQGTFERWRRQRQRVLRDNH